MLSPIDQSLLNVWRPTLLESSDGEPLVRSVSDFYDFPYDRLPKNPWVSPFLRPDMVIGFVLFYLISKPACKVFMKTTSWNPKSEAFRWFIGLHNLALAIFSAACTWNSWPIVLQHLWNRGAFDTYCDPDGSLWRDAGLGSWATIFYISKYYEFMDTWILVLKGKDVSFLQVYHHTGIAFFMYLAVASQSAWLLFVVLFNSFIHTLMYTYFFIKTVSPKTEIKAARNLTMAQITQFITGMVASVGVLFMGSSCDTQSSRFALALGDGFIFGLIGLFMAFANRKYKKV